MKHLKAILVILIALVVVILAVQNNDPMSQTVQFRINPVFVAEMQSPPISLYQVVIIVFLLGVLTTGLYGMIDRFRLRKRIQTFARQLEDKDKELNSLRNLPITSEEVGPGQTNGT
jgi:uncharacterized membrane protein YciS (DUF1049 family)